MFFSRVVRNIFHGDVRWVSILDKLNVFLSIALLLGRLLRDIKNETENIFF